LHQAERKRRYERLHPATKHGGDRKSAKAKSARQNGDKAADRYTKDAAKKTGKSERSVQREIERANKIAAIADAVGTSLDAGDELDALAKLPDSAQRDLILRAKAGKKVTARHEAKLLRRKEREVELAEATEAASQALGKKLYGLIYADPAWRYSNPPMGDVARANENHYQTQALDDIKALKLPAADDCALFMWATIPLLDAAIATIEAWGLKYKSAVIWEKDRAGTGYWIRGQVEVLMIATRGNVPAPAPGEQFPALVKAPRGRHSEKPNVFAEMIERLFPNVPKLEMFARKRRPGWDVWGNEAEDAA
jgi:N6-adenosine-specific RNA methylase IME4